MDSREFVADPNRPDEATAGWIYRPPDIPLQVPTQDGIPHPVSHSDVPLVPVDPWTSINLQYAPQPTPLVPSQFNQRLANPIESIHAQQAHLPEEVQQQLAEVEWQHEVARYQILEKAQAIPTISRVQEASASDSNAAMSGTAVGYTGADEHTKMSVHPFQVPNHGSISTFSRTEYGFDANFWPSQQLPQPIVYPDAFKNHFQDVSQQNDTFLGVQDLDHNAFGHSAYSQQPATHPVTFETSHYHTMLSVLGSHDQGNYYNLSMVAPRPPCIQLSLPLYDVRSSPVVLGAFPTCQTNRPLHGLTTPHEGPSWDSHIPVVPGRSLDTTIPAISHSDTTNLGASGTLEPQLPVISRRGQVKRGKRKERNSKSATAHQMGPSYSLDNIYFHSNPDADRQRRKFEPRRRQVTEKASSSCFGCRLNKRKVCIRLLMLA